MNDCVSDIGIYRKRLGRRVVDIPKEVTTRSTSHVRKWCTFTQVQQAVDDYDTRVVHRVGERQHPHVRGR